MHLIAHMVLSHPVRGLYCPCVVQRSSPVTQAPKRQELEVVIDRNVSWLVFSVAVHYLVLC